MRGGACCLSARAMQVDWRCGTHVLPAIADNSEKIFRVAHSVYSEPKLSDSVFCFSPHSRIDD